MSINANHQLQNNPVVIGPPPGITNIYVRPKRPQPIFQPQPPPIMAPNNVITSHSSIVNHVSISNSLGNHNLNNQIAVAPTPRMRQPQNNQRPPPGTVNLERSYQICQAVIQNSSNPNRHQLNNQLKPPPQMKKF